MPISRFTTGIFDAAVIIIIASGPCMYTLSPHASWDPTKLSIFIVGVGNVTH